MMMKTQSDWFLSTSLTRMNDMKLKPILIGLSSAFLFNSVYALTPADIALVSKLISDANQDSKPRLKASVPAKKQDSVPIRPIVGELSPQVVEFPYHKDYIYPIYSKPGRFTNIELPEGEEIVGWYPTDKTSWISERAKSDTDIFIKPIRPDVDEMPAKLVTNKRKYQLLFISTDGDDWYQRVSWAAPEEIFYEKSKSSPKQPVLARTVGIEPPAVNPDPDTDTWNTPVPLPAPKVKPEDLNLNYKIEGEAYFKPLMVFDDGKWTWFKFPKDMQIAPPLFELDANGGATVLEYQPRNGMYFVQQILPYGALFKLNKEEVRIYNLRNSCGGLFQSKCVTPSLFGGNQ